MCFNLVMFSRFFFLKVRSYELCSTKCTCSRMSLLTLYILLHKTKSVLYSYLGHNVECSKIVQFIFLYLCQDFTIANLDFLVKQCILGTFYIMVLNIHWKMYISLCSRNFQNVTLWLDCQTLTIFLPLRFHVKSNFWEFKQSKNNILETLNFEFW